MHTTTGRREVKEVLKTIASLLSRRNNPLYNEKVKLLNNNKTPIKTIIALARKLLIRLNTIIRDKLIEHKFITKEDVIPINRVKNKLINKNTLVVIEYREEEINKKEKTGIKEIEEEKEIKKKKTKTTTNKKIATANIKKESELLIDVNLKDEEVNDSRKKKVK